MKTRCFNCQRRTALALLALASVCAGGCWETIKYTGPPPADADPAAATASIEPTEMGTPSPTAESAASGAPSFTSLADESETRPSAEYSSATLAADRQSAPDLQAQFPAAKNKPIEAPTGDPPSQAPATVNQSPPDAAPGAPPAPPIASPGVTTAAAPASPAPLQGNTRRAAWQLGTKLTLAALANDRGAALDRVPGWLGEAQRAAEELGVSLKALPPPPSVGPKTELASTAVRDYLFRDLQDTSRQVAEAHGVDHAALFGLAVNSTSLIVLYEPGSEAAGAISRTMSTTAPQAAIPVELWQPVITLIERDGPLEEVRKAIRQFYVDVDQHLARSAEPAP